MRGIVLTVTSVVPSDVITLVVLWRLRYKFSLRDPAEMVLLRGLVFSYEAVGVGSERVQGIP